MLKTNAALIAGRAFTGPRIGFTVASVRAGPDDLAERAEVRGDDQQEPGGSQCERSDDSPVPSTAERFDVVRSKVCMSRVYECHQATERSQGRPRRSPYAWLAVASGSVVS